MSMTECIPAKKESILNVALELFTTRGFHGATTAEISKQASAGVGSIYRYFKDKDELIHALFAYIVRKINVALSVSHDQNMTIKEQFISLGVTLLKYLIDHPNEAIFMEQYFYSPYGLEVKRDAILCESCLNMMNPLFADIGPNPLHDLIENANRLHVLKNLPHHVQMAIATGPIVIFAREINTGLYTLDDATVVRVVEACWDAIRC